MSLRTSLIAVVGVCALALAACDPKPVAETSGPGDDIVQFVQQNTEMNAAIAQAKASLPVFLARLDANQIQPTDSLKVGFPAGEGHEHIWVNQIAREGDQLTGVLANEPNAMPGQHRGSVVVFPIALVSDWSYEKDGKRWGNYTTRVMLPYIAPEEADAVRESLSDTPTESNAL